ncbi:hypothetical protein [Pseudomonas syringae group genomosp. 3]|uniref:hypothetical protein n=1 Tax=Pseudomonas syringae group genomosp. 3 TaxID=251701 RepID=UPI0011C3A87E|nr:hypothetical protein [Pseudomonas syringae group genomosp. 3]
MSNMALDVAACNRNGLDLQSSHFSTGIRGCTPESPKITAENIMRVVPGCFCYPIRFFVHIWPLNQAVFGLAVSLPENNCLASIRTITGFPPMTEISAVPAYNPD